MIDRIGRKPGASVFKTIQPALLGVFGLFLYCFVFLFMEFLRGSLVEHLNLPAFFHYEMASSFIATFLFFLTALLIYTRIRWGVWSFSNPIFDDPPSMLFYQMGRLPKSHRAYFEERYEVSINQRKSS